MPKGGIPRILGFGLWGLYRLPLSLYGIPVGVYGHAYAGRIFPASPPDPLQFASRICCNFPTETLDGHNRCGIILASNDCELDWTIRLVVGLAKCGLGFG